MRAEPRVTAQSAKRVGAHAVRRPQVPDEEPARASVLLRYVVLLTVLFATLAFVALDTFSVQRARLADFVSKPISKVRIENQWQHVSEGDVTAILQRYIGAGFFDFDINGASRDLEALPWVASVDVRRVWPDTLSLHLKEEMPIAKWGSEHLLNQYRSWLLHILFVVVLISLLPLLSYDCIFTFWTCGNDPHLCPYHLFEC